MIFTPDAAEAAILADVLAAHDYALKLFVNDKAHASGDTEADYAEATFPGYSAAVLTLSDWTITPGDPAVAVAPEQVWTQSADATEQLAYGYILTRADTGALRWVERFTGPDAPFAMARAGDRITVTPLVTLRSA